MNPLIVVLLLAAAATASPGVPRGSYHGTVGIREAARIKQAEMARDFDGARIVGGVAASLGSYPYFGGLLISLQGGFTSVCGASLLSNTRALTAAQCWWDGYYQGLEVTLVLGTVYLFYDGVRVTSRTVIMHEEWDPFRNVNDIAMIQLSYVPFTNVIQPISLPSNNYDSFAGVAAQVTGFGFKADDRPINADQYLSSATVQVITNQECAYHYPRYIFGSNICTSGAEGRGPCISDVGGPLSAFYYGRRLLIGVTQFTSVYGCEIGFPAGYSRVSYYLPWIYRYL